MMFFDPLPVTFSNFDFYNKKVWPCHAPQGDQKCSEIFLIFTGYKLLNGRGILKNYPTLIFVTPLNVTTNTRENVLILYGCKLITKF